MTVKHARGILASLNMVLRIGYGEFEVRFKTLPSEKDKHPDGPVRVGRGYAGASYFTNDLEDAVATAKMMAAEQSRLICKMMVRAG